jgi:DNA-binding PadR family transcriptional regulator
LVLSGRVWETSRLSPKIKLRVRHLPNFLLGGSDLLARRCVQDLGGNYSTFRYSELWGTSAMTRPTLPSDSFHILIALADRERHGYSILQEIAERTSGKVQLSPSSLYSAIKRLLEVGLIEELDERPDPEHDDVRRRYYRVTGAGRCAAAEEARHLQQLLMQARAAGLVPRRT